MLCKKETNQDAKLWDFWMLGSNFGKFLSFLVFLQILHYSSVLWHITPLYFCCWNFIYFQQKESIKVQIWRNFTWAVENLKFCTLMGFFHNFKFSAKRVQKSYLSWHWRVMQSLKNNWLVVSNMTRGIRWLFVQLLKSLKVSLQ